MFRPVNAPYKRPRLLAASVLQPPPLGMPANRKAPVPVPQDTLTFLFNPHRYGKTVGPHHTIVLPTVERTSEWAPYENGLINIPINAQHAPALAAGELVSAGAVECFEANQQSARTRRAVVAGSATRPVHKTVLWGGPAIVEELLAPHEAGKLQPVSS